MGFDITPNNIKVYFTISIDSSGTRHTAVFYFVTHHRTNYRMCPTSLFRVSIFPRRILSSDNARPAAPIIFVPLHRRLSCTRKNVDAGACTYRHHPITTLTSVFANRPDLEHRHSIPVKTGPERFKSPIKCWFEQSSHLHDRSSPLPSCCVCVSATGGSLSSCLFEHNHSSTDLYQSPLDSCIDEDADHATQSTLT